MKIKVLFFASLKDFFGEDSRILEISESSTVEQAVERLDDPSGFLKNSGLLYAVNEDFENKEKILKAGDCLALMTPVSGG